MTFILQLDAAGRIGDTLTAFVASIDPRVFTAPDLSDAVVGMNFLAVEEHGY